MQMCLKCQTFSLQHLFWGFEWRQFRIDAGCAQKLFFHQCVAVMLCNRSSCWFRDTRGSKCISLPKCSFLADELSAEIFDTMVSYSGLWCFSLHERIATHLLATCTHRCKQRHHIHFSNPWICEFCFLMTYLTFIVWQKLVTITMQWNDALGSLKSEKNTTSTSLKQNIINTSEFCFSFLFLFLQIIHQMGASLFSVPCSLSSTFKLFKLFIC